MGARRRSLLVAIALVVVLVAAACDFQGTWTASTAVPVPGGAKETSDLRTLSCLPSGQCIAAGTAAALRTGTTWTELPSPPEIITGLACASTTNCLATDSGVDYVPQPPSLYHFDGSGWTTIATPAAVNFSVGCSPSGPCLVLAGTSTGPLAWRWDGTSLTAMMLPASAPGVDAMSCPTATFCMAVGGDDNDNPGAMAWTGGPSWATVPTSGMTASAPLYDVSCASATFCETTNFFDFQIGTWNGTTLTGGPSQGFQDFHNGYLQVACPTTNPADCELSSSTSSEDGPTFFGVSRQGGTGTGAGFGPQLYGLACMSASSCVALGDDATTLGRAVYHYNGTSWAADTFATVHADTQAESLSCPTTSFCMLGGSYAYGGYREPYVRRWNGSAWTTTPLLPAGSEDDVQVGCLSATACLALVFGGQAPGDGPDALDTWDGTSWTQRAVPDGGGAVACTGTSFCLAATGDQYWTWDGTTLSGPTGYSGSFPGSGSTVAISCSSSTHCVLVTGLPGGAQPAASFNFASTIYTWDGTTMSAPLTAPAPAGQVAQLSSVSCPSTGPCRAVGAVGAYPGPGTPYVLEGDGASWSAVTIPATGPGYLAGVSCANANECLAVGNASVKGTPDPELLLAENGAGTWYNAPDLPASGSVPVAYDHIACVPLWCAAVGIHTDNGHPTVSSAFYTWTDTTSTTSSSSSSRR